ncbi:hypothetical protein CANCADRAFT_3852 [Tortispora caseinolytica NRRL Y-17796]|uniref:Uncharacterized protein n=1 Tax=Tortispora caseinolytica NRRL Y-17796 TaxID=767744 RepID=A0A1E4TBT6_9ASCO|nr:hypothetical protein CANCADRAFT_3852 [Tortispora caseinolytica NRRL Y-17796]
MVFCGVFILIHCWPMFNDWSQGYRCCNEFQQPRSRLPQHMDFYLQVQRLYYNVRREGEEKHVWAKRQPAATAASDIAGYAHAPDTQTKSSIPSASFYLKPQTIEPNI